MSIRSTRLEVDLDALSHNFLQVRGFLDAAARPPQSRGPAIAAVVKADGYGLGAVGAARAFAEAGADMLAVACLPEALELARAGLGRLPILVMGHTPDEGLPEAVAAGIRVTIFGLAQARLLSEAAAALGSEAVAHVKVDTGMNRLGLKPGPDTGALLAAMAALPRLRLEGIFTHLALLDAESDRRQFELFMGVVAEAEARGLRFEYRHACDSIGLARYPDYRLDLVRPGAILYGARPGGAPLAEALELRVPFAFTTRISRIARIAGGEGVGYDHTWRAPAGGATVATLPVGYVDGYRRCLSNRAEVLVRGLRAKVAGLVCMDQMVVDVSGVPGAAEGDEVLLFGRRAGGEGPREIGLAELAAWAGTNRNEILSGIGRRVPRIYMKGGAAELVVDYLAGPGGPKP